MPTIDASWTPVAALIMGGLMTLMIMKVFGTVFSQAMAHHQLILSARTLRNSHVARMREIERAIQRESADRAAANAERNARVNTPPIAPEEVGVDILEAA